MPDKKMTIIIVLLLSFVLIATFAVFQQQAQEKSQQDVPTVVHKGQITEKAREYSKEYKKMYLDFKGRKLSEISEFAKRKGSNGEAGVAIGIPSIPTVGNILSITSSDFLRNLSCKADAVVFGSVQSKTAHLTEDETFVYTEYEFLVRDILKNTPSNQIELGKSIQITRPGGLIKLDNQVIRVEDRSYRWLQTGKEYLLFLRYIPSTGGYMTSSVEGDFILEGNSFKGLSVIGLPEDIERNKDSQSLLETARSAISTGCVQNSTGGK